VVEIRDVILGYKKMWFGRWLQPSQRVVVALSSADPSLLSSEITRQNTKCHSPEDHD